MKIGVSKMKTNVVTSVATTAAGAAMDEQPLRILVVDDAVRTRRMLTLQLEHMGYAVTAFAQGTDALAWVHCHGLPNLVLVDATLADMRGTTLAEELQCGDHVPVLLLASPADLDCEESLLSTPATCLLKPFVFAELLTVVQQLLRPTEPTLPVEAGECALGAAVRINFPLQSLTVAGRKIALTPTETRLLLLLYAQRGRVVSPDDLISKAWEPEPQGTLASLWVHIQRLRNKLELNPKAPTYLITVRGQGYCLHSDHLNRQYTNRQYTN